MSINSRLFIEYSDIQLVQTGVTAQLYFARRRRDGAPVCLKICRATQSADPERIARFLEGARLQSQIAHPNVLPVWDTVHDEGNNHAMIVLPWMSGGSLASRFSADEPGCVPEQMLRLRFGAMLCAGVTAIHDRQIVHGDIKPLNLLLDDAGILRIADFGEAHAVQAVSPNDSGGNRAAIVTLSPHYAASERARGYPTTFASDRYAVGATLFRLLCGRVVFEGERDDEIMRRHAQEEAPDPRTVNPALPETVTRKISALLSKDPARRPALPRVKSVLETAASSKPNGFS